MSVQDVAVRAIYLAVFTGCFYYLTDPLPHRFSRLASIAVLAAGLLMLYVPSEKNLWVTLLRYVKFVALYGAWTLIFLRIKVNYALYLSVFHTIFMGVWFSCVQIAFLHLGIENDMVLAAVTGACRVGSVALIKRFFIQVDGDRTISLHEMLVGLFPAVTCFIANLAMYDLLSAPGIPEQFVTTIHFLVVFFGLSALIILVSTESYFKLTKYKRETELAQNQLSAQYRLFLKERENDEMLKALHHDMKNHLLTLEGMAQAQDLRAYIARLKESIQGLEPSFHTGNATLDAILSAKQQLCREKGIRLTAYIAFEKGSFLTPMEICTLFANCIDNAIEAAAHEAVADKHIRLAGGAVNGNLVVKCENPYAHALVREKDAFRSTKRDGLAHGYGLRNMRSIVEGHNGALTLQTGDNRFVLVWMIPIPA